MSHLKRLAAPKTWNISRKDRKFIIKTSPGPHKKEQSIPLVVLLRDMLGIVKNSAESKKILHQGFVLVNKTVRRKNEFPVGLMDIIELPLAKKIYRLSITRKGKLYAEEIEKAEERLCRIEGKTVIGKGKIQLNLFGGENIIVDKDDYKIGDVLKLGLADRKVNGNIVLSNNIPALIIGGSHVGEVATIKGIDKSISPTEIMLEDENKKEIRTRLYNVYPIEK
jgi:small subunit ribosomal protein S4e|tara:strand:+ start:971 stop:1639 length:669 start_codon:yes stop_codon:yes gene_type:complete